MGQMGLCGPSPMNGERGCWAARVEGLSLGKEDRGPGHTQPQGTCSRIPTAIHKDIPLPFLPLIPPQIPLSCVL